jgi:hypothetical protein
MIGFIILLFGLPTVTFALPPAIMRRSVRSFFGAALLSLFGIVLPFLSFISDFLMVPDWKGGCKYGWVDCFHVGKLALVPLVLWACTAFYRAQILYSLKKYQASDVLGLFIGMVVSGVCLGHVIATEKYNAIECTFLAYPFAWYSILAIHGMRRFPQPWFAYFLTLLGSLPFWAASIWFSIDKYRSLPETPRECFIVTAASSGHESLVGPFMEMRHRDEIRRVNRQLSTFWKLEGIWSTRFPRGHRFFRRIYNRIGPRIARRISTPWRADIIYLLLKPAELIAAIIVHGQHRNHRLPHGG